MKTIHLSGIVFLFLFSICFAACNDDNEPTDFRMSDSSYEVQIGTQEVISIVSGNNDYTIKVENEEIIDATYNSNILYESASPQSFTITGKKKGETNLRITDNVVRQTIDLKIKVVDFYLPFAIDESNHPALEQKLRMFLIKNDRRDVYFFSRTGNNYTLISRGQYEFKTEKEGDLTIPYLTLTYASDENGKFTDAAIAPTPHKFDLTDSHPYAFRILKSMLDADVPVSPSSRNSPPPYIFLNMHEVGTDYTLKTHISKYSSIDNMPKGYLE